MPSQIPEYVRDLAKAGYKPLYFPKREVIKVDDLTLDLSTGTITLNGKRVCEYNGKAGLLHLLKTKLSNKDRHLDDNN